MYSDTGSAGSGRSLQSQGSTDIPETTQSSNTNTSNHWQEYEETALLDHLTDHISAAGDSLTFPKHIWKSAVETRAYTGTSSQHRVRSSYVARAARSSIHPFHVLAGPLSRFLFFSASEYVNSCPIPSGSKACSNKPPASCQNKWAALKSAYHQVQFIKSTSGLTWSDADGVGVSPESKDVWNELVRSCPGAKPFGNKGFVHFTAIDQMMNSGKGKNKAKGVFVLRRKMVPTSSSTMLPPPIPSSSHATLPETQNPLNISLATSAEPLAASSPSNSPPAPSPTSPCSFITSTNPSAMTSASHSGNKHKYSALGAGASDTSQKKPRTPSASVQAQQEGSAAMTKLVDVIGDLSKKFAETTHMAPFPHSSPNSNPASHLAQAIDIIHHDPGLSAEDILDMVEPFSQAENEASAVAYVALSDTQLRSMWVWRRLKELRAKSK
ncbi:hypothetical protein EV702DRAFT_1197470 [Suillus placidus]|uniref:Myb/SANT-like domain-containing protein n=1 Tax=Suillus placidus TaxID=48579 RepID=A0A9P6ZUP1_9AGAM|nr:hypothetical protein EV702DRAFT_1197470 [Suillus placidus]